MTTPIEHLFCSGERVRPEDVPPEVLAALRRLAAADPKRGASVLDVSRWDAFRIYSLVIRDGTEDSGAQESLARGGESA